jgi:transposase
MNQKYEPALKKEIIRLYLEDGRTMKILADKYNLGKGTLRYWLKHTCKECDNQAESPNAELQRMRKQNAELRKENDFLKKAAAFFAKEID